MRALTVLSIILILTPSVAAQPAASPMISGTVIDETGAVVPGAAATLTPAGARQPARTAITNARGEYVFESVPAGTYEVAVSLSGFNTATRSGIVVDSANVVVPALALTVGTLGETIVVSASRNATTLIDAPATMSVISSTQLATTPAQNYADLLRTVPGVNAIQLSARDVNLTNRAATSTLSNSQLVLLDGRSIYLDFFGLVLWDFVPTNPGDIKQIEIVRGPASAVWGANALTGAVNIITKSPREAAGTTVTLTAGGFGREAGSTKGQGAGHVFGANATYADAPNSIWSYRVSAGYFHSSPLPRPVGQIPVIQDPRDPTAVVGGATYPADGSGPIGSAFQNVGTSQPKFDARVDQEVSGGRVTYAAGVAGSEGIIHTGIGPFDIQSGSYQGYGKVAYSKQGFRASFFTNFTNADAPNLLLADPATLKPLQLNFSTQTYDVEVGDSMVLANHHALTVGGNVRRNNFDITIAPAAENRTELGAYAQDEIFFDKVRVTLGGRIDKFGNLSDPVFSPRLATVFKPSPNHAVRVAFNRAFRSPSVINNFLDIRIVFPTDLRRLAPALPPALQPLVAAPFPLIVRGVGSELPIGGRPQTPLTETSLTAYEVAYTATINERTTATAAFYVNDNDKTINFTPLPPSLDPYTAANPPPGWQLPPGILTLLASQGIFLPRTAFTYLNLGPTRDKGLELSVDYRVSVIATAFANYSYQAKPAVLSDPNPYPLSELSLPPAHRFNIGFNFNGATYLGSGSVSASSRAFWSDVLTSAYHGFTDAYALVNGSFGVKWLHGRVTTSVKATNILNKDIQQHVFGDIIKRSVLGEVKLTCPLLRCGL